MNTENVRDEVVGSPAQQRTNGGDLGALMRAFDWSKTSLGPMAGWPQSLRTATDLLLLSPVPIVMLWGTDGIMIYNDAYSAFAGARHPGLLGSKVREGWPEVAEFNDHVMKVGLAGGTLAYKDQELTLYRSGTAEQVWMNLDYSPVLDESGRPAGVIAIVIETSERIRAERSRHEAETALRVQHDRARGVLENMNEAFILLDGDLRVIDINSEALRLERRSRDDVLGKRQSDAWPGTESSEVGRLSRLAMAERVATSLEHRYVWADGHEAWLDLRIYPTSDGLALFYRDVTERKRAEVALRQSEQSLRDLNADLERQVVERSRERGLTWQVSPDLLGVANAEEYFEASNPAWASVLGWSEAEIARTPFLDILHPDDLERTRSAWEAIQRGQPALRFENRYRGRDGEYRWLSWVAVPEGGKVYCSGRDVTDEKTQAEQLTARTAERDRLWNNTQDLQVVIDARGAFQNVNPAFTRILGWSSDEAIGRTVFDFVLPEDEASTGGALDQAIHDTLPVFENRYRHKDGGYRWISWVAAPDGELIYASGRHITAEKEQAAELAHAQEQLRQAQKMEAVGQLTGGIAHDFNNLLAGIVGSLDLMQTRLTQGRMENIERYAKAAMSSAQRAAALTHRLLAFSRRQPLDPRPVDANALVTGMEDLLRRSIGPLHALEFVTAGGLWTTLCDPNQLESAILNLAINARDAMPDGGKLTVETCNAHLDSVYAAAQRDIAPGQYICICVTDTGTGMPPEVIARAFEPFFTTKPLGQGTGLGLSMVYGFAKQSEGHLKVYSEEGRGTTVKIYLPRHRGMAEDDAPGAVAEAPRAEAGETVLVVEDEPVIRDLVVEVLQELGYRALEAADGLAGLKILQSRERVDLLVTDVGLPGLNGRQLADHARTTRPGLKVLFVTGYAENATVANGFLDPGMEMITKPFAIETLAIRIKAMIQAD